MSSLRNRVRMDHAAIALSRELARRVPHVETVWNMGLGEVVEETLSRIVPAHEVSFIDILDQVGLLPARKFEGPKIVR